jgi:hypothetical protein
MLIASACESTQSDIDNSGPVTTNCKVHNPLPNRQVPRFLSGFADAGGVDIYCIYSHTL